MTFGILLAAVIVLFCVFLNKFTQRFGVPMLLTFILLGMAFGSDGIFKIPFDNYAFAEQICSVALIFIMFYGGFGTGWRQAKPVAVKAGVLATVGVALTAALVGFFCHFILGVGLLESFLIGSVISSTDAASVFSILRSKRLGLKYNTDSMLELESGSNDPTSYMLTVIVLAAMGEGISAGSIVSMLFAQFAFGIALGVAVGFGAAFLMRRFRFATAGFDMAFVVAVALLAYASATLLGGNGYLSVYLCGIILGNRSIHNQEALVHFFDGVTGLMQMLIFFLLGLLATPSRLPQVLLPALAIMLFLTVAARPLSVFAILSPFRCPPRQQMLVSFAGLRGAASIVFAIMATVSPPNLENDLFHIVFCIVLLSITFQGSLLPLCARWLGMTDGNIDVMKTFSDYSEETDLHFIKVRLSAGHPWAGQELRAVTLPPETLVVMLRRGGKQLVPHGKTVLLEGDEAVLSAYQYGGEDAATLREHRIPQGSEWAGKTILDFSPHDHELVILLIRNGRAILPQGGTKIAEEDILVIHSGLENENYIV